VLGTFLSFRNITSDLTRSLSRVAAQGASKNDIAYWRANISKVTSIDAFIGNTRLLNFAMKAYGLQDMAYAKGFVRKILQGGVEKPASFANRLTDTRYREFAAAFDFAKFGPFTTGNPTLQSETADKYLRQTLEENAGASNEGVRLALYFQRKAPALTSALSILADKALLSVVRTTLNLPVTISLAPIDTQTVAIEKKLDIASLKDPAKLRNFLQRFASLYDLQNTTQSADAPQIAICGASQTGIGVDTLMSIARLQRGG
jgi:Protein of unknown function (DUF1217)